MKLKTITLAITISLLGGCATVLENYAHEQVDLKAVESKKREYPNHIRNGVSVEETNSWYLGSGESFKKGVPPKNNSVKVVGWNLPDDAILKYKPLEEIQTETVKLERFTNDPIEPSVNLEKTVTEVQKVSASDKEINKEKPAQTIEKSQTASSAPLSKPEMSQISEEKKTKAIEDKEANIKIARIEDAKRPLVKAEKNKYAYKKYPGDTDHVIIEASMNLPDEHNLDFQFDGVSLTLLDESRERLVHKAPLLLVYNRVDVVGFYDASTTPEQASKRAMKVRKELLRAGSNPDFVHISIEQGVGKGVELRAKERNDVKIAYVEFIGQGDQFVTDKLDNFLTNFAPNATKWVRISAGADAYNSLSRALRVKNLLTEHGIDRESITILHRQEPIKTVKTLIYFKEG